MSIRVVRQISSAAAATLLTLAVAGCNSSKSDTSTSTTASSATAPSGTDMTPGASTDMKMNGYAARYAVTVKNGKVVGGPKHWPANMKDHVALTVTSDVADRVHVRCVDKHGDVEAGGQVTVKFDASTPGACRVELEHARLQLGVFDMR